MNTTVVKLPDPNTIAYQRLIVAISALVVAAIGVFFGLPNLLKYLAECKRKKRQDGVRDVLLKFGQATVGDFMLHLPKLSQAQIECAVQELHRANEITPHGDVTGQRTIWMFKIHPHVTRSRFPSRF